MEVALMRRKNRVAEIFGVRTDELLTITEASILIGVSRVTMHKYISDGRIKRYGQSVSTSYLLRSEVEGLVKEPLSR